MNDQKHAMQAYQDARASQGIGVCPAPTPRSLSIAEVERQDAIYWVSAARSLRQDALRFALEMVKGTAATTDWDGIVKAARVFLAFIENG
jgi:hypothetical protein